MPTRRRALSLAAAALIAGVVAERGRAQTQSRLRAVATFSILGDLASNVGGDRMQLASLVGPNGDVHVYAPTPSDLRTVTAADIVIVNGLGLEGWLDRLIKAAGSRAPVVVASRGVAPRESQASARGIAIDAHAWQSVANAKIYVANIRDGLIAAEPGGEKIYQANAAAYLAKLDMLDAEIKAAIDRIPAGRRKIVTVHRAFGYFGEAYGIEFAAPEGLSSDAEASPRDVAQLIEQIRREKIPALFMENVADPRLIKQIADETGARIGGTLYSDALSSPDGPAGSYIAMMRHNVHELTRALLP